MPVSNSPNLAALQAAIISSLSQAITDSQTAIVSNTDSKTAALGVVVGEDLDAVQTSLAAEVAAKAAETQAAVNAKGVIKSIQRGTGAGGVTVTIAAVDLNKAFVSATAKGGNSFGGGGQNFQVVGSKARLSSATQLVIDGGYSMDWEVIEYA